MNRGIFFAAMLSLLLLSPTTASAKGPTAARITGPGLENPLLLNGFGESGDGSPLAVLTMKGGFFEVMFGPSPGPLPPQPRSELGPRYDVVYTVPGGTESAHIRQSLFPYAADGPVLYTPAGQPFFDTERTRGGWFQGGMRLKAALVRAGLAKTAPAPAKKASGTSPLARSASGPGGGGLSGAQIGLAAGAIPLAAAVGAVVLVRRRRSRNAVRPRPTAG